MFKNCFIILNFITHFCIENFQLLFATVPNWKHDFVNFFNKEILNSYSLLILK